MLHRWSHSIENRYNRGQLKPAIVVSEKALELVLFNKDTKVLKY
jgi:hypothetical protein